MTAMRDRAGPAARGIAETYAGEFALLGVTLPLQALASSEKPGLIADAGGHIVARVNPEGRSEQEACELARLIALGIDWFANMTKRGAGDG